MYKNYVFPRLVELAVMLPKSLKHRIMFALLLVDYE